MSPLLKLALPLAVAAVLISGPTSAAETCSIERAVYEVKDTEGGFRTYITMTLDYAADPDHLTATIYNPDGSPADSVQFQWAGETPFEVRTSARLLTFSKNFDWMPMPEIATDAAPWAIVIPAAGDARPEIWTLFFCQK
ncbi:MAG: hypothetical protein Q7V31_15985 [Parvibaculum sp.]|uniref:hypothetical protein n=1 Tax=Parvibaculum sp. TaxID=2024848 RepID=UPI00271F7651|nr:hypothetical protein [Parvibaculum sp.]MDO8840413.1 hypothetical protein [Parvibaculum sp.]